jgi:hypothetical protein
VTVHKDATPTKLDRSVLVQLQVAELRRGCGDHMPAIQILDRALAAAPPHNRIELLFLRGMVVCICSQWCKIRPVGVAQHHSRSYIPG